MVDMTFTPTTKHLGTMDRRHAAEIKNEPMLFSCDFDTAWNKGGSITREFLNRFLSMDEQWVIDSRVHMLMPSWYPCIPGWHHDDVLRTRSDGQPDYFELQKRPEVRHVFVVIDALNQPTNSLTEYLTTPITLTIPPEPLHDQTIYGIWNDEINRTIADHKTSNVNSSAVWEFGTSDFHRGVPASSFGWRIFIRASKNSTRQVTNEQRTQSQVYLPVPEAGW